jgi:hypothetical protein
LGARLAFPGLASAAGEQRETNPLRDLSAGKDPYSNLLQIWCDGLLTNQITGYGPALRGGLLCPACVLVHGRSGDAVYPLLRMASSSGNSKYLQAALLVYDWSEQQVSRSDGSWVNDVTLSSWQGITVFRVVALAEALHHHGHLLDGSTRQRWTERLARAAKFLDGFITIETGNINYPITASYAFALCAEVLDEPQYLERARKLAHASLEFFTSKSLLFGEGHPLRDLSPKNCRPVDLGYNVEESLPSLALYALIVKDKQVLDQVISSLRTHMEFMLPDGAWDNSWGTRNYKWSWWGSRTSDGCCPAYVLLAQYEPRFREVARRNLELMATCTHNGLLYGGPDYFSHGDLPCIHHTFTHAKALATVLDRGEPGLVSTERLRLPRDEAYGIKTFPEIGTRLAAIGDWRATVTEYDWEYVEHIQRGGADAAGGGHATGGALSLLFHCGLGPILVASMTEYGMIEISNQQAFRDAPHMPLTPRIECAGDQAYTSLSDLGAILTVTDSSGQIAFDARGRLLSPRNQPFPQGDITYHLIYLITESVVEIVARASVTHPGPASVRFILPVVSRTGESVEHSDPKLIQVTKPSGTLIVRTEAAQGFESLPAARTFNLVPGFECIPIVLGMQPGKEIRISLEARPGKALAG